MNRQNSVLCVIVACILSFSCLSCSDNSIPMALQSEELFSIGYGKFDNQINLFNLASVGSVKTYVTMQSGFFYVVNGESQKILELNSYGDLLTLFYNPETNVSPDFVQVDSVSASSTRKAVQYPFSTLGPVSVDSRKKMYVVDTLPKEQRLKDPEKNVELDKVVIRFDSDGSYLDYLGQQGPGGTPFPYIKNIYTTDNDQLVVVCTTNEGPVVYWFSDTGFLEYIVIIHNSDVPNPLGKDNDDSGVHISIENVVPSHTEKKLFVKVDYFSNFIDQDSKVQSGIDYTGTYLYTLAVDTGEYGDPVPIPAYELHITQGFSTLSYAMPYDFIGATSSDWLFFAIATEKGYTIQMVQADGQKIIKRTLDLDSNKLLYYTFAVSESGIVSGLFASEDKARVIWWRTDNLVNALTDR
nr:hypothetical protein [Treponema sp.]